MTGHRCRYGHLGHRILPAMPCDPAFYSRARMDRGGLGTGETDCSAGGAGMAGQQIAQSWQSQLLATWQSVCQAGRGAEQERLKLTMQAA